MSADTEHCRIFIAVSKDYKTDFTSHLTLKMEKNKKKNKNKEKVYEVETILKKKTEYDTTKYLVKWKDYPDSFNTWEKESNFSCPELIAEFEKQQLKRKRNENDAMPTKRFKKTIVSIYCRS